MTTPADWVLRALMTVAEVSRVSSPRDEDAHIDEARWQYAEWQRYRATRNPQEWRHERD